jgi:hypothetical protein
MEYENPWIYKHLEWYVLMKILINRNQFNARSPLNFHIAAHALYTCLVFWDDLFYKVWHFLKIFISLCSINIHFTLFDCPLQNTVVGLPSFFHPIWLPFTEYSCWISFFISLYYSIDFYRTSVSLWKTSLFISLYVIDFYRTSVSLWKGTTCSCV